MIFRRLVCKKTNQEDIEEAKTNLKKKNKEVRNKMADILLKASEIVREDKQEE